MSDMKKTTQFMDEARRMGVEVLGPDVNESRFKFAVNKGGAIRFGLGAMKGVGEGAVMAIIKNRVESVDFKGVEKIDPYKSLFDFAVRLSSNRECNKKVYEALALGGAFDELEGNKRLNRSQYFTLDDKDRSLLEQAMRYGQAVYQADQLSGTTLFGDDDAMKIQEPEILPCKPWSDMLRLKKERDVVGFFISGHPLDKFKFEMNYIATRGGLQLLEEIDNYTGKKFQFGGLISNVEHRISKSGSPWGMFTLEDYYGSFEFRLFRDDYLAYKNFMVDEWMVFISGIVQKRPSWGDNPIDRGSEFKVTKIEMLSDVREQRLKRVHIDLNLKKLNEEWVNSIVEAINSSKGKVGLTIDVYDGATKVVMPSRNSHVEVSNEFIEKLEELCQPGVANYRFDINRG